MISRKHIGKFFYVVFFAAMYAVYYRISQRIPINSDMASGLIEAIDVAAGNIFLKGWSLSTVPFYFTDILTYAAVIKVFWYSYKLSYIIPSVILSLLCMGIVAASENKNAGFLTALFFVGSPVLFLAKSILVPVIHVGTYLYCVAAYIIILKYLRTGCRYSLAGFFALMAVTFFSDGIAVCLILLPSLAAAGFNFLFGRKENRWYIVAVVSLLAFAVSKVIWALFRHQGFDVPYVFPTNFSAVSAIWVNFSDFMEGFIRFSGGYFFGMDAQDHDVIWKLMCFVCASLLLFVIIARIVRFKTLDSTDIFLLAAVLVMPLAFCVSSIASGITSVRYIIPMLIFGSILASRHSSLTVFNGKFKLLVAAMLLAGSAHHVHESLKSPKAENHFQEISSDLSKAGLKNGFADFWFASSVSLYGQVHVSPVHYDFEKFTKMNWLSKEEWFDRKNTFVIIHDEGTKKTALKAFGVPSRIVTAGGLPVYVWDGIKAY
ncbi:hypothetical protein N5580_13025 [Pantoea piersonii]|uniref:Uncharacterized protein n=1 Tax=Pantoea piersonii TaxID=2364647 RepID=A0AAJ5QHF7_9GAMM|nr:hypothetical protein [Pantoea piersonii]WBG90010.1 hypothetical protein N5580_13025 [Pantoea piersonii]